MKGRITKLLIASMIISGVFVSCKKDTEIIKKIKTLSGLAMLLLLRTSALWGQSVYVISGN